MSLDKTLRSGLITAIGAGAFALAAPAAADVIVKSSGPSAKTFPVGKKLKSTARITLKAGDTVTILGKSGTRILKGAGTYRVGGRGASTRVKFADVTRNRSRARPGVARAGTAEDPFAPNIWFVDVTKSGKMCLADLEDVTLWRPQIKDDQTFVLSRANSEFTYPVTFDGQANTRKVDKSRLALQAGTEYSIKNPAWESSKTATVNFAILGAVPDNPEAMAETLIAQGCTLQLDLLAHKLEAEAQ